MFIIPAYGRTYSSTVEALKDWHDGKDFKIHKGPYCSIRDYEAMIKDFGPFALWWDTNHIERVVSGKWLEPKPK